jgi:hypothetical protein
MRFCPRGLAVSLPLAVLLACGDDGGPAGTAQDFTGTYAVVSFSQGTAAGVTVIPGASGTVTLTATTYAFSVSIPIGGVPFEIDDEGTYTATGTASSGTWSQESTVSNLQSTGTYEWDANTDQLTLDTTVQSVRSVIVLEKG